MALTDAKEVKKRIDYLKKTKLNWWRRKYKRRQYPVQVAKSLVMELIGTAKLYEGSSHEFGRKVYPYRAKAMRSLVDLKAESGPSLLGLTGSLFQADEVAATISMPTLRSMASEASQGDDQKAEDVEFGYLLYMVTFDHVIHWMSQCLSGSDPLEAFNAMSPYIKLSSLPRSFDDVVEAFKHIVNSAPEGIESTFYKAYSPLPPLSSDHRAA